jgi:hypothetical protein
MRDSFNSKKENQRQLLNSKVQSEYDKQKAIDDWKTKKRTWLLKLRGAGGTCFSWAGQDWCSFLFAFDFFTDH